VGKCKSAVYGRRIDFSNTYKISDNVIEQVEQIKDLGVMFDSKLIFEEHIHVKINKTYQMLGVIKRNFIYLTPDSFMVLYKALVCSHIEYVVSVWNPHHQILIEKLEQVQKRATKLVIAVKHLKYDERLKQLNLPTLKYRRIRGDINDWGI